MSRSLVPSCSPRNLGGIPPVRLCLTQSERIITILVPAESVRRRKMIVLELEKYIICWKIQTKYEWNNKKINVAIKLMMTYVQISRLQKEQVGG